MPTSQQTSLTWRPPSTSFSTLMICVSVNRDFFMAFSVNGSLRRRTLVLHEATEGDAYSHSRRSDVYSCRFPPRFVSGSNSPVTTAETSAHVSILFYSESGEDSWASVDNENASAQ